MRLPAGGGGGENLSHANPRWIFWWEGLDGHGASQHREGRVKTVEPNLEQLHASIGRQVRRARSDAGITQGQLASLLDLPRTAVVAIEGGRRRLLASELLTIASTTGRPLGFFLGPAHSSLDRVFAKLRDAVRGA